MDSRWRPLPTARGSRTTTYKYMQERKVCAEKTHPAGVYVNVQPRTDFHGSMHSVQSTSTGTISTDKAKDILVYLLILAEPIQLFGVVILYFQNQQRYDALVNRLRSIGHIMERSPRISGGYSDVHGNMHSGSCAETRTLTPSPTMRTSTIVVQTAKLHRPVETETTTSGRCQPFPKNNSNQNSPRTKMPSTHIQTPQMQTPSTQTQLPQIQMWQTMLLTLQETLPALVLTLPTHFTATSSRIFGAMRARNASIQEPSSNVSCRMLRTFDQVCSERGQATELGEFQQKATQTA